MNKKQLVSLVSKECGYTQKDTERVIDALLNVITESLVIGEKVLLVGFGTFDVRKRKAREVKNPRNHSETIYVPETTAPFFKAGKNLRDAVNNKSNR